MGQAAEKTHLKEETLRAFTEYIGEAESTMGPSLAGEAPFLWVDLSAERTRQIQEGKTLAELWSGKRPVHVPEGLVHDWVGASRIPGATLDEILATVQDYDNHKNIYKPEVIDSRLISRLGNDFEIQLRLLKKKIVTVILDTVHQVHYSAVDPSRWVCRSYTSRIGEVEDAGKPSERVLPADTGYGYLWRLYSYWRFQAYPGGVDVECRAISLTRDVPKGLAWVIEPIIRKLPRESLIRMLEATRKALTAPRSN